MSKPKWVEQLGAEVRCALALCDYAPPEERRVGPWLVEAMCVIGEQLAEEQLQRDMDRALIQQLSAQIEVGKGFASIGPTDEPVGL